MSSLRIAAADVTGKLPLMNVSDRLTDIAEIILVAVVNLAWKYLVARHGRPVCDLGEGPLERGFAVIAYGKAGRARARLQFRPGPGLFACRP